MSRDHDSPLPTCSQCDGLPLKLYGRCWRHLSLQERDAYFKVSLAAVNAHIRWLFFCGINA